MDSTLTAGVDTRRPDTARRRSMVALFVGAAAVNAAMVAGSTAATLLAADVLGAAWGGLPAATGVAGTAGGVAVLSRLMSRRGRRAGLLAGTVTGALGAAVAAAGAWALSVPLLVAGMVLLGVGNAAAQLARYAAAELWPVDWRGVVLGSVVWAGTVGAVGGPLLLTPATSVARVLGVPPVTGPFGFAAGCFLVALVAAGFVVRRPVAPVAPGARSAEPLRALLAARDVRLALAAMLTAQLVMVGIMTAAPVEMHEHGSTMGMVGLVLSAHTLGMFALAPLSGRLADAVGGRRVIVAGLVTLALSAVLVVERARTGVPGLPVALFVLGYGWNLAFVGSSRLLVRGLPAPVEARVQGVVEGSSWAGGAAATLASTLVLGAAGYSPLAVASGALVVLPAAVLVAQRRRPPTP